jgi:hypothetical protein
MKHLLIIILLSTNSVYCIGQNNHETFFNRLTDDFCDCASKAKDKIEFEICGNIIKAADSIQLTETDKVYFFNKLKSQCGDTFTKHWGQQRPRIPSCSFLQETDLKDFNLQKSGADKVSVQWTNENKKGIILDLIDHRTQFTSDSLAQKYIESQQKLTLSDDFKKTILSSKTFQSLEIINFGAFGNYYVYQIYARCDSLIYFLSATLSKEDLLIIEKLIEKLSSRVKHCN